MGRKILADAGYDVVTVNNGSAALKKIAEIKPDLIVLDVYMPGYSGLEVCQRLKDAAETEHVPVLLTVGKLEPFKADEARRVRADAHIVKPFEASELLTAIARLEDRIVPQPAEAARFITPVAGVERFNGEATGKATASNMEADAGWRSRLRFPSLKKREEAEPETAAAGAAFRNFRKAKTKTGAIPTFDVAAPSPEPGLVSDPPRDITLEELDALSDLAAKLDGPIPAAAVGPDAPAAATSAAQPDENSGVASGRCIRDTESSLPANASPVETERREADPPASELSDEAQAVPAAALAPAIEGECDGEKAADIAIEPAQPVLQAAEAETPRQEAEIAASESPETPAAYVTVDAALLAQEPAPVDRDDEPRFAAAESAIGQAAEEQLAPEPEKTEATPEEAVATAGASALEMAEPGEPAPSDEELAEALRLLTPTTVHGDVATLPADGSLAADAAGAPRWVAEPVALKPEEAAISLEAEMFGTLPAMPGEMPAAESGGELELAPATGVSAITAAVESRLAEAGLVAAANSLAEPAVEQAAVERASVGTSSVETCSVEQCSVDPCSVEPASVEECPETAVEETVAANAAAEAIAAVPSAASPSLGEMVLEKAEVEKEVEKSEAGREDSLVKVVEEAPAEAAAEEAPKVMAAAASTAASLPDASTIASIVDSVMADLRPRIVEEIARKLAGK
jgi:CheY-like chemotaxis protein